MPTFPARSILVATDLGKTSGRLIRAAAGVAAATGAQLHVLHAFDFQPLPFAGGEEADSGFTGRVAHAERVLERLVHAALPPGMAAASQRVVVFIAHKAILERADDVAADLIVLGPHRSRRGGRFLGATADRVVRTATVPILVIPDDLSLPLRNVVAPTDLSEPARIALVQAVSWIAALGASEAGGRPKLHVLHVIPRLPDVAGVLLIDESWIGQQLEQQVAAARQRLGGAPEIDSVQEVRWGERPAQDIVRYAEQTSAELLVLGTHGRGALERALIGSVASAVARRAPCPVLLVPPPR